MGELWFVAPEIVGAIAFVGACLAVASASKPRKSPFAGTAGWLDAFVLIVVAAGAMLLAVGGEYTILLVYIAVIVACATVGAALDSWGWLLAGECAALGVYVVLLALIIASSAGSWNRRSYDVTEGTLAIMEIYWVTMLMLVMFGGMTVGATARRRLDLSGLGTKRQRSAR